MTTGFIVTQVFDLTGGGLGTLTEAFIPFLKV